MFRARLALTQRVLVLTSASLVSFVVGGSCSVAAGLFLQPLLAEFHWANSLASGIATAYILASLLAAPIAGALMDRFGGRALMASGLLITAAGFLGARYAGSAVGIYIAFVLAGLGSSAAYYVPVSVITTSWMGEKKNLGMGIVMGATSIGAASASVLISWSIEKYGWHTPLETLAASMCLLLPLVLFTIEKGPSSSPTTPASQSSRLLDSPAKSLLRSPLFLVGTGIGTLFNVGMASIYYHVVSLLEAAGYTAYMAGTVLGATWILSAFGSLILGTLAERRGAQPVLTAALLSCALGTALLIGANDGNWGLACVVGFALLWGATANSVSQFLPVIFSELFGEAHLGMLLGVQSAVAGIASAAAPLMTGFLYDRFKNYHASIFFSVAATLVAALLTAFMRAPRSAQETSIHPRPAS
jgi:MFS family permease